MTDHRAEQFSPSAPIVNTAEKVRRFPSTSRNRKRVIISGAELFPLVLPPSVLCTIFAEILACTSPEGKTDSFMNFFAIGDEDQKTIVAVLPSVLAGIKSRGDRLALSSCQKEHKFSYILHRIGNFLLLSVLPLLPPLDGPSEHSGRGWQTIWDTLYSRRISRWMFPSFLPQGDRQGEDTGLLARSKTGVREGERG